MVAVVAAKSVVVLDPPDADTFLAIFGHDSGGESLCASLVLSPGHTAYRPGQSLDAPVPLKSQEYTITNVHVVQEAELFASFGVLRWDRNARFDLYVHVLISFQVNREDTTQCGGEHMGERASRVMPSLLTCSVLSSLS